MHPTTLVESLVAGGEVVELDFQIQVVAVIEAEGGKLRDK